MGRNNKINLKQTLSRIKQVLGTGKYNQTAVNNASAGIGSECLLAKPSSFHDFQHRYVYKYCCDHIVEICMGCLILGLIAYAVRIRKQRRRLEDHNCKNEGIIQELKDRTRYLESLVNVPALHSQSTARIVAPNSGATAYTDDFSVLQDGITYDATCRDNHATPPAVAQRSGEIHASPMVHTLFPGITENDVTNEEIESFAREFEHCNHQ